MVSCGNQNEAPAPEEKQETEKEEKRVLVDTLGEDLERMVEERYKDGPVRIYHYYQDEDNFFRLEVWRSGRHHVTGWVKDGKREGDWYSWYENGKIWSSGRYENGLRQGKSKVFYDNGSVRIKQEYYEGKPHGTWVFYDEEKDKVLEVDYNKGEKIDERRF